MGKDTKISWTSILDSEGFTVPGSTFSPWEGCAKVSAGCKHCYAESQHNFYYSGLDKAGQPGTCWGVSTPRLARSEAYWRAPHRWNQLAAAAQAAGTETNRRRVFCASMADVFEVQSALSRSFADTTGEVPSGPGKTRSVSFVDVDQVRVRLLRLIHDTPALDWLLLTKRPENVGPALRAAFVTLSPELATSPVPAERCWYHWLRRWVEDEVAPANVWLGTSVEHQQAADERIPHLLAAPAAVRFLSCEPLVGAVELPLIYCGKCRRRTLTIRVNNDKDLGCATCRYCKSFGYSITHRAPWSPGIDWVIIGGESGHLGQVRTLEPTWAARLIEQARDADVPVLMKQLGTGWARALGCATKSGTDQQEMPASFRFHQSPPSSRAVTVLLTPEAHQQLSHCVEEAEAGREGSLLDFFEQQLRDQEQLPLPEDFKWEVFRNRLVFTPAST